MGKHLEAFKASRLDNEEQIICSALGYIGDFMGGFNTSLSMGDNQQINGELILTNKRIVFYAKKFMLSPEVYKGKPLNSITSLNFSAGFIKKTLEIVSSSDVLKVKFVGSKSEINEFQKQLELKRDEIKENSNVPKNVTNENIPDQIKKLAELKDLGILSEDEFNIKKKELLDKM